MCLHCDEGHIKLHPAFHIEEMIFISWAGLKGNCIQSGLRFKPIMNFPNPNLIVMNRAITYPGM